MAFFKSIPIYIQRTGNCIHVWTITGPNWPSGARIEEEPVFKGYRLETDKRGNVRARKVQHWTLDEAKEQGHSDKLDILIEYYERRVMPLKCDSIPKLIEEVWAGDPRVVLVPAVCWGQVTWDLTR